MNMYLYFSDSATVGFSDTFANLEGVTVIAHYCTYWDLGKGIVNRTLPGLSSRSLVTASAAALARSLTAASFLWTSGPERQSGCIGVKASESGRSSSGIGTLWVVVCCCCEGFHFTAGIVAPTLYVCISNSNHSPSVSNEENKV